MPGQIKDHALARLLKDLAANNLGLCVLTTRYSIVDLKNFWQSTAPEVKLPPLSIPAGVALLKSLGVKGVSKEFESLVEDVKGHALTLNLLGSYLVDAHGGDIRRRDRVKLAEANAEVQGGHAFHVMDAYVQWFSTGGKNGEENQRGLRALALLQLLGLFDRPVDAECLNALLKAPAIAGLTELLVELTATQRNITLKRLEDARLLSVSRDTAGNLLSLDAHPLLREYFAALLKEQQNLAWRAAHRRVYEYLCTTREGEHPRLEDLQPLFQAVVHGCLAGLHDEVRANVYRDRIQRGNEGYSTKKLGALGFDLCAIACFFDVAWTSTNPAIADFSSWLFNEAAFTLTCLGRLNDALEPMHAGLSILVAQQRWIGASIMASNLSELTLTLGLIDEAKHQAEKSVRFADYTMDLFQRMSKRTTLADALHQAGCLNLSREYFIESERIEAERQPERPLVNSIGGFRYCELLLAIPECVAWRVLLGVSRSNQSAELERICCDVVERVVRTREWTSFGGFILDIALEHLILGRASVYQAHLDTSTQLKAYQIETATIQLDDAVDRLRGAGMQDQIPRGLLTRAWLRYLTGNRSDAQADLNEAWEIAEPGPMPLHQADIHLHRARLFGPHVFYGSYPWDSPEADLKEARRLIEKHGYWRRKEELEDAETAAKHWPEKRKSIAVERAKKMKIPNSVVTVVGEVLGDWYKSHGKLNALFKEVGFPGEPPEGNCIKKCQLWLKLANESADTNALALLGGLLVEFMNLDRHDDPVWQGGFRRVTETLAKNDIVFDLNGNVAAIASVASLRATEDLKVPVSSVRSSPMSPPATHVSPSGPTIVLVTVNDNETHAVFDAFLGEGQSPEQVTIGGVTYSALGNYGGNQLIHTICEMGAGGIGASQQRTREAIEHWHPKAIIAVGIAFGLDENKQKIGDVLVSTQLQDYELARLNEDGILTPRGDKPSCADVLRNRLRQTDTRLQRCASDWPRVRFGLVLCGQKLVDNLDYRESLRSLFSEAIGGEMEGLGVYVSATAKKTDWIVVKAICDWGHDKSHADKEARQKLAANNAARVLKAALDIEGLYV